MNWNCFFVRQLQDDPVDSWHHSELVQGPYLVATAVWSRGLNCNPCLQI